jgi:hypothetical protein
MIALGECGAMGLRELERALEQANRAIDVVFVAQEQANPTRIGQDVVWLGFARGYDFVAHALGKRDVNEAVSMDVADFAPAEAELDAAETVRRQFNASPLVEGCADSAIGS